MRKRPIIGITPGFIRDKNKVCLGQGYIEGVNKAGGLAVILPLVLEDDMADRILETVDGILFSGGPDIDAKYFGEENMKDCGEISPERDSLELLLAKKAIEKRKPVFGICRGMQLLNVALGGSLYQDIHAGRNSGDVLKHWQEAPGWYPVHNVKIIEGSRLQHIYRTGTLGVNSYHHQAVRDAGSGLSIVAKSSDGVIEAVESSDNHFIAAVQWHPEIMWQKNTLHLKLFEEFVAAADGIM